MTPPQATLRAALEKHGLSPHSFTKKGYYHVSTLRAAILEAMEQHRREALEEVEAYVKHLGSLHFKNGYRVAFAVRRKIAALKTSGLTESEK